jgi:hypothetical protein
MGFFLLVKLEEYRSFVPLYMAGKAVAITANLGWFFFSLGRIRSVLAEGGLWTENTLGALYTLGFLLILAALDALSVLGASAFIAYGPGKPKNGGLSVKGTGLPETHDTVPGAYAGTEE